MGTASCLPAAAQHHRQPWLQRVAAASSPLWAGLQLISQQCRVPSPFCQLSCLDLIANSCCLSGLKKEKGKLRLTLLPPNFSERQLHGNIKKQKIWKTANVSGMLKAAPQPGSHNRSQKTREQDRRGAEAGTTTTPEQAHSCLSSCSHAASPPLLLEQKPSSTSPSRSPTLRLICHGPPGTRISQDGAGSTRRAVLEGAAAPRQHQVKLLTGAVPLPRVVPAPPAPRQPAAGAALLLHRLPPRPCSAARWRTELTRLRQPRCCRGAAAVSPALMTQVEADSGALQEESLLEFYPLHPPHTPSCSLDLLLS